MKKEKIPIRIPAYIPNTSLTRYARRALVDPRRYTLDLICNILGEGISRRQFARKREHLGLAYDVQCFTEHLSDPGVLIVYAGLETEKQETALEAILEEREKIKKQPISEEKLDKAREMSEGRLLLSMEDTHVVADSLGSEEIITGIITSVAQVIRILNRLTPADIQQTANEIIKQEKLCLAVVGPDRKTARLKQLVLGPKTAPQR